MAHPEAARSGAGTHILTKGTLAAAAFIAAERRSAAPLLRLGLFANRAFAVAAAVTVLAMFAFLGMAYATSIRAVNSGPLGANAVPAIVPGPGGKPMPFNPLRDVAFHALSHAYSIGYLICGIAALAATLLTVTTVRDRARQTLLDPRTLADE